MNNFHDCCVGCNTDDFCVMRETMVPTEDDFLNQFFDTGVFQRIMEDNMFGNFEEKLPHETGTKKLKENNFWDYGFANIKQDPDAFSDVPTGQEFFDILNGIKAEPTDLDDRSLQFVDPALVNEVLDSESSDLFNFDDDCFILDEIPKLDPFIYRPDAIEEEDMDLQMVVDPQTMIPTVFRDPPVVDKLSTLFPPYDPTVDHNYIRTGNGESMSSILVKEEQLSSDDSSDDDEIDIEQAPPTPPPPPRRVGRPRKNSLIGPATKRRRTNSHHAAAAHIQKVPQTSTSAYVSDNDMYRNRTTFRNSAGRQCQREQPALSTIYDTPPPTPPRLSVDKWEPVPSTSRGITHAEVESKPKRVYTRRAGGAAKNRDGKSHLVSEKHRRNELRSLTHQLFFEACIPRFTKEETYYLRMNLYRFSSESQKHILDNTVKKNARSNRGRFNLITSAERNEIKCMKELEVKINILLKEYREKYDVKTKTNTMPKIPAKQRVMEFGTAVLETLLELTAHYRNQREQKKEALKALFKRCERARQRLVNRRKAD